MQNQDPMAHNSELIFLNESNEQIQVIVDVETAENARSDTKFAQKLYNELVLNKQTQLDEKLIDDPGDSELQDQENPEILNLISSTDQHLWSDNETKLLLTLYKENKNKSISVKHLFKFISTQLKENGGYNITPEKCNTKLQALKRSYKKVQDHNKKSGNNRKSCKHYEILQDIFDREPWIKPVAVAGTSVEAYKDNDDPPKKKKKENTLQLLLMEKKLNREDSNRRHREKIERIDKLQQILEKIAKEE
ncbi:uncharacterized protein [Prorops nasuta]|uniref:uncharacterized protein n=1 Tax=Prorops nasuta TaxID=863751 RepID=UPI0034CFEE9B